jgi:calmodulin
LFDKEGKGEITTIQIGFVLRNLGLFPTEQELNQMLNDIDINGNERY